MKKYLKPLYNGIIKENPTFVLMLGMCPTLAVTTSAINGMGMGLTTMTVLIMSNFVISLLRKIIPSRMNTCLYSDCSITCNSCSITTSSIYSFII